MKNYDPATLAALGDRRAVTRFMLRFDLPEGAYGFWSDRGKITYNGLEYVGAGSLISIEDISGASDLSVEPITVHLSSIPNTALTPGVLATIHGYQWHQAPATLYTAYFHPDTRALIMVERIARRRIDTIDDVSTVGGPAELVAKLQPLNLDNPQRGFMVYGDADQRLIDADDGWLAFAATAGTQTISWGRLPTNPTTGGLGG
jgi:hypothetical protein